MRMSIVACAVLGGSAACAAAQNHAAPAGSAGATAVKEYVCTDKCRDGARPSAGAAQDAPALFTVETVSERRSMTWAILSTAAWPEPACPAGRGQATA